MKQCRGCGETFPKKGRKYKVVVRANGKKISKTVPNLELAREVERKIKLDIVRNDFDLNRKKNAQQLKTVWNDYFVWAQSNKKSWYTDLLNYEKHLAPSLSNKPLDKISPFDIEAIMLNMKRGKNPANKKYAPATIKHQIVLLQRLYSHAIKKTGYSGPNPCLKVDKPTIDNEVTEFLTDSELNRLMKTLNSWPDKMIAGIVKFAILTGLRKGEILTLTWNHVNLEQKSVYLKSPKGKKSITLPLSENACSVLQGLSRHDESLYVFHHWQGKPYNDVRKSWLNIKKQAELPTAFRFHGLRHSFASALVSAGTSLHIVSKLLTHKNTKVTERYSHLSDKALRDALKLSDTLQQKKEPAEIIYLKQQQHG